MKVIVATHKGQGLRDNDFDWVPDGEIVTFGSECDGEAVDGACGCHRSLAGVDCRRATTTMEVVDKPDLSIGALTRIIYKSHEDGGWHRGLKRHERNDWAQADAEELARIASTFEVGDVLERRGETIQVRPLADKLDEIIQAAIEAATDDKE